MEKNKFEVSLGNKHYDIKSFLKDHPGGVKTLQHYRGKSVQKAMAKFNHSNSAYHLLNDFKIDNNETVFVKELVDSNLTGSVSENGRIITKEEVTKKEEEIRFLEELESRLDWSKPILRQMDKIAPHYHEWVNCSVYKKCRLFESPILESLTFTPWYLVLAFWIPIITYIVLTQYAHHVLCEDSCTITSLSNLEFVIHFLFGVFIWTLLEYSLHRWVFHLNPGTSLKMIKMHFLIHGMHHKVPFDGLRQVFPPIPALIITAILYVPVYCIFSHPLIKLAGGLTGYLTYDMIHYYVHHGRPVDGTYLYAMKRYHSNHHFINHDKAYGISSKVWDYVFNTFVQVRKLGFSLQW